MSFVQEKLSQATFQTQSIFNMYVYEPANGDASTDVIVSDYFSASRFLGDDGWVDAILFCKLSDGFFMMQIQSGGTTASQVGAGGGEIPAIQDDISELASNVRGVAVVDMGGDDYTLTDEQSLCAFISVVNQGTGKTLTFPTSTDATRPASQTVFTVFCTDNFTIANQSGGVTLSAGINTALQISTVYISSGIINISMYTNQNARGKSNGIRYEATAAGDISDLDAGTLIVSTNAAATVLTVLSTMTTFDYKTDVVSRGAGGVTLASDGTSVLTGTTALATGESVTIYRDGSTNNFQCV